MKDSQQLSIAVHIGVCRRRTGIEKIKKVFKAHPRCKKRSNKINNHQSVSYVFVSKKHLKKEHQRDRIDVAWQVIQIHVREVLIQLKTRVAVSQLHDQPRNNNCPQHNGREDHHI